MKKNHLCSFLIVFVITLFANNLYSQGAYVNISAGYGLPTSTQNLYDFDNYVRVPGRTTYEQVDVSLGKGINIDAAFGYMLSKYIGAEMGLSFLIGGKSISDYSYRGSSTYENTMQQTISANMFRINPSIVISSGIEKVNPYAKFGMILGVGSILQTYNETEIDASYSDLYERKNKLNGGIALGFNASIGVLFNLSETIALFGEVNMINLSYAPTKGVITEYTYNGKDLLPDMNTSEKEVEFVDSYEYIHDSYTPADDWKPSKELKTKYPFGSIGFNIGLRISF